MKKLHYPVRVFKVILKRGEEYTADRRCVMRYAEPTDGVEDIYTTTDQIRDFIKKYCSYTYTDYTWKFKKYITFDGYSRKLLIDDIQRIEVSMTHKNVEDYKTIKSIGNELKYDEFLQFVFDKEQELKSIIMNMNH